MRTTVSQISFDFGFIINETARILCLQPCVNTEQEALSIPPCKQSSALVEQGRRGNNTCMFDGAARPCGVMSVKRDPPWPSNFKRKLWKRK